MLDINEAAEVLERQEAKARELFELLRELELMLTDVLLILRAERKETLH